ncbi:Transcriptional regulatory protein AfsQ1 [Botrimarina colliarenosi]|uniref:Transcriptional regulatory protein AfsQ1 n=1 Tax=Botrimarina colliarenosi TaxID=2528001 RepID=A0A5C6AEN4_9BACT|nr:response regulator [Botrimarina colliarenosi]TWT97877.1 Transcriptional regulatory protein AfsQ1 [Botrimarina colliarenosi]
MADTTRKTILLIEEDATLREITQFRLELLGHDVFSVASGNEGVLWLTERLPDALMIGHFLPDMDGMDLVDRLSNDVRTAKMPVMLLSPNAELADVQRAFNAGADDYLVTPFDPMMLERKLKRLLAPAGT